MLCKEFDEKKVILSNPSSKEELNALIGGLTLEDPKLFEYDGKKSTIYRGLLKIVNPLHSWKMMKKKCLLLKIQTITKTENNGPTFFI